MVLWKWRASCPHHAHVWRRSLKKCGRNISKFVSVLVVCFLWSEEKPWDMIWNELGCDGSEDQIPEPDAIWIFLSGYKEGKMVAYELQVRITTYINNLINEAGWIWWPSFFIPLPTWCLFVCSYSELFHGFTKTMEKQARSMRSDVNKLELGIP